MDVNGWRHAGESTPDDPVLRIGLSVQRLLMTAPAVIWSLVLLMRVVSALFYRMPFFQPGGSDFALTICTGVIAGALLLRARLHCGAVVVDHRQAFIEIPAGMASGDRARRAAIAAPPGRARIPFAGIREVGEGLWWIGRAYQGGAPRYRLTLRDDFGAVRFSLDERDRAAFYLFLGASPTDQAPLARAWKPL